METLQLAPPTMATYTIRQPIAIIHSNLLKYATGSLYLQYFNHHSVCQSRLEWPFCHVTGIWMLDEE